jgi:hypothetical protein
MSPPTKRNARRAPGGFGEATKDCHHSTPSRIREQPARPFVVIAVRPSGKRTIVGSFPTLQAEKWAAMLRGFASWAGGGAVVEHAGGER